MTTPSPVAPAAHTPARRPIRRLSRAVAGVALAAVAVASTAGGAAAAGPGHPTALRPGEVAGDPHSPATANFAVSALAAQQAGDATQFAALRAEAARAAAADLGVDPEALVGAFARADAPHQVAVLSALSQLGVEYQSMTSEPGVGFDCSGLTSYAWRQAGVEIPRQSGSQIADAEPISESDAQAGDLVYYPGHVSMYLGTADALVHAANPERDVELAFNPDRNVEWGDPES